MFLKYKTKTKNLTICKLNIDNIDYKCYICNQYFNSNISYNIINKNNSDFSLAYLRIDFSNQYNEDKKDFYFFINIKYYFNNILYFMHLPVLTLLYHQSISQNIADNTKNIKKYFQKTNNEYSLPNNNNMYQISIDILEYFINNYRNLIKIQIGL